MWGMLNIVPSPETDWSALLARLPADLDLNALARETKAIQRERGITDAADLLRLGLMHGPGGKTLKETSAWAYLSGVAELKAPALSDRLHQSVAFFDALTSRPLSARAAARPTAWHGRCLHLCDSSSLSQPGSKGTDWRIHAIYDLERGGFSHLELTDGKGAESLNRSPPAKGEVMIAGRGYAKAAAMARFLDPAGGERRDLIVRTGWNMLRLETAGGMPFDLIAVLERMKAAPGAPDQPREWAVQALHGRGKQVKRLPLRLVILPLPPEKTGDAVKKVKRRGSGKQHRTDPRSELAAGFMMLVTSLPPEIPAMDICAVYRLRWQIELAFKRLKSLIKVDQLPTHTRAGSLSWLYAHLILALLTEDVCQEILAFPPCGGG